MGGVLNMWGAVIAALLMQLLPAILHNLGVAADWLTIVFGIGVLQVLTTAPAGLADQFPRDMRKLGGAILRRVRRPAASSTATPGGAA
jgi:branched-chain amino acid transport system permease protein